MKSIKEIIVNTAFLSLFEKCVMYTKNFYMHTFSKNCDLFVCLAHFSFYNIMYQKFSGLGIFKFVAMDFFTSTDETPMTVYNFLFCSFCNTSLFTILNHNHLDLFCKKSYTRSFS